MSPSIVIFCFIFSAIKAEWLGIDDHCARWDEVANLEGTSIYDQFSDDIIFIGNGVTIEGGKAVITAFLESFYPAFDNVKYSCDGYLIEDTFVIAFDYSVYYYKEGEQCGVNEVLNCKVTGDLNDEGLFTRYNYICPPDQLAILFGATTCEEDEGDDDDDGNDGGNGKGKGKGGKNKKGYGAYIDEKNFMQDPNTVHTMDPYGDIWNNPVFVGVNVLCVLLGGMVLSLITYIICDKKSKNKGKRNGKGYESAGDVSDTDI